jgi:hypothetical protein
MPISSRCVYGSGDSRGNRAACSAACDWPESFSNLTTVRGALVLCCTRPSRASNAKRARFFSGYRIHVPFLFALPRTREQQQDIQAVQEVLEVFLYTPLSGSRVHFFPFKFVAWSALQASLSRFYFVTTRSIGRVHCPNTIPFAEATTPFTGRVHFSSYFHSSFGSRGNAIPIYSYNHHNRSGAFSAGCGITTQWACHAERSRIVLCIKLFL